MPQAEKVEQISRRNSLTLKKMFSQKKVQDEDMLKSDESFIGLGVASNIPKYLRYNGVVMNRNLDWKDCVEMILMVLTSKKAGEKAGDKKPVCPNSFDHSHIITPLTGIRIFLHVVETKVCDKGIDGWICVQHSWIRASIKSKVDSSQNVLRNLDR